MSEKLADQGLGPMSRDDFRVWVEQQPGRYELIWGVPVKMNAERAVHNILKMNAYLALRASITAHGLPCEAFGDGMTVEIDENSDYEPDASVRCGERLPRNAVVLTTPVIVVEVASPSTWSFDVSRKFPGYFGVPSIRHFLMLMTHKRQVIHHRRTDEGTIISAIISDGTILLDPPGLSITVDDLYRDFDA